MRHRLFAVLLAALATTVGQGTPAGAASAAAAASTSTAVPSAQGLPPGMDVNEILRQLNPGSTATPAPPPSTDRSSTRALQMPRTPPPEAPTPPADVLRRLVRSLLKDGVLSPADWRFLEAQAADLGMPKSEAQATIRKLEKEEKERLAYLVDQVGALAVKGELSRDDRLFLERRAQDMGLDERDAMELVDTAFERSRKLSLYRSILSAFLKDGLLDDGEDKLLQKKREELGLTDEDHETLLAEAKKEAKEPARDVLAAIREADAARAAPRRELELYGRELFRMPAGSFEAVEALPPPDSYLVGPGDRLQVSLWGRLEAEYTLDVDREGKVLFPRVGPVKVGGLTYAEARSRLKGKAEAITGVSAAVTLSQMRSLQVFVVGEAERPGGVTVTPLSTAIQAVLAAGGPTPLGSLRQVTLRRAGQPLAVIDLYDFLQRGEAPTDRPLHPGDVIVIPKAERVVKLTGKVKRPALYELKPGEGLRTLLNFAGGLTPDASGGRLQVERNEKNRGRTVLDVSLSDLRGDFPLADGDVVRVFALETTPSNAVALHGQVVQPGTYAFRTGMRVSDLIGGAENLKPGVELSYAVVLREMGADRVKTVLPLRLSGALDKSEPGEDLALQPGDEVYVFSRTQFRPPLTATVTGEVRTPGVYRFEQGARVADVLRLAGGTDSKALLTKAELLRYLPDRSRQMLYVDLDKALAGDPRENLTLADEDELVVHPASDVVPQGVVLIQGEVNRAKAAKKEAEEGPAAEPKPGPSERSVQMRLADQLKDEKLAEDRLKEKQLKEENPDKEYTAARLPQERPADASKERQLPIDTVPPKPPEEEKKKTAEVPLEIPLTRGMTVRDLVFKAGGLSKDAYRPVAQLYRADPTTKQVTIHTFDLGKAMDGDPRENLVLQDLDHVVILSAFNFVPLQWVLASGMVNQPGEYPYATNMRVRDLILAAGGLKEQAYLAQGEIVRSEVPDGKTIRTRSIPFPLAAAMAGDPEANAPLAPYDRLFVQGISDWKESRKVELRGEVLFPGTYYIANGEKLSSVLQRAGGYRADAYLPGAIFTRESARQQQQKRFDEMRDKLQQAVLRSSSEEVRSALSSEDVAAQQQYVSSQQALLEKLRTVRATGRVVLKLLPLASLEGSEWDVALEDGDTLTVPKRPQTVSVVGQVYNPSSLLWEPDNRTVGHYLNKTGGPTTDAEKGEIYVVRTDGTVVSQSSLRAQNWWGGSIDKLELAPGDSILVPEKIVRPNFMKDLRDLTQILYQIAVTAGVTITLF